MKKRNILFGLLGKNKKYIFLCVIAVSAVAGISLMPGFLLDKYINAVSEAVNTDTPRKILAMFAMVVICLYIGQNIKNVGVYRIVLRITDQLRMELFLQNLGQGQKFYNRYSAGEVIEHMENDIDTVESFIISTFIPVFINAVTLIGILCVFFVENPVIGVAFLVYMIVSFRVLYAIQKKNSDCIAQARGATEKLTSFWNEVLLLRVEINAMKKWRNIEGQMDGLMDVQKKLFIDRQKYLYRVWNATLLSLALANALSFLVGGFLFFCGRISLGTVYLIYTYSNQLRSPMENMQLHLQNYSLCKSALKRINEMYFYEDGISDGVRELTGARLELECKQVSFDYGAEQILKDVSFQLKPNELLGIFGESGAGKSTLGKLICKMYEPREGEILLNGIRIQDLSVKSLRENVAYITPMDQIFSASWKDNLTVFGDITDEEMVQKIRDYRLQSFLHMEGDADVMERLHEDVNPEALSKGERQLLNVLRVFFCRKKLLIFDEAAANIDEEVEDRFFNLLNQAVDGHTAIIITHNVERLAKCDKILALEKGKVLEYGSRETLQKDHTSLYARYSQIRWNYE